MPRSGPGAMAPLGRRLLGILIDWALCYAIAIGVFGYRVDAGGAVAFIPLAVLLVEHVLLVSSIGGSVGHRLMGLHVGQVTQGTWPVQVLVRTLLLCLFFPAIFTDPDGRGFHDRIAGTVIARK